MSPPPPQSSSQSLPAIDTTVTVEVYWLTGKT